MSYKDIEVETRWFEAHASLCNFRESWLPSIYCDPFGGDLFVPLPLEKCLWVSLFIPALWSPEKASPDILAPDPPHECAVDGCDFTTDNYGVFLTHDQRNHVSEPFEPIEPD